jgi:hypothetical protein
MGAESSMYGSSSECHALRSRVAVPPAEQANTLPPSPPTPSQVGLANIFILHTSASLTINENASPDVLLDLNVGAGGQRRLGFAWLGRDA